MIREILIKFEELSSEVGSIDLSDFPSEKAHEYSYHVELLLESGLIHGQMSKTIGLHAQDFFANRLTWEGHEFLDAIRIDNVWNKTKIFFVEGGLSMTFELIKGVATDVAAALLKTAIN